MIVKSAKPTKEELKLYNDILLYLRISFSNKYYINMNNKKMLSLAMSLVAKNKLVIYTINPAILVWYAAFKIK